MSKSAKYLLFLVPACLCESFCDKAFGGKPKVIVANSTHLSISWEGVFTDCLSQEVRNTDDVSEHGNITIGSKFHVADFEKQQTFVKLDPCQEYNIFLNIRTNDGRHIDSDIEKYNDMSQLNIESLYNGLLKDTSFVENVCLVEEKMIRIPEAPEEVKNCVLTKGDQANKEFTAPGQSHFIPLQIVHPHNNKETLNITAMVTGIETCPSTTTTSTTTMSFQNKTPVPKIGGTHFGIVFGSAAFATIFVVALFSTAVCLLKRSGKKKTAIAQLKDINPVYGEVYYHLDK